MCDLVKELGKAPGYALLAHSALIVTTVLCAAGRLDGSQFVVALGAILGVQHGAGVLVSRRDSPAASK